MKVLFCHDGPLRKDEDSNYYGIAHNDQTFRRYYTIADEINVAIRVNEVTGTENKNKLSKITIPNLSVHVVPNISSAKGVIFEKKQAKEKIRKAVIEADYIIVRFPSITGFYAFRSEERRVGKECRTLC